MHLYCFHLRFKNTLMNSSMWVSVCRGSHGGNVSMKEMSQCTPLMISKRMKKFGWLRNHVTVKPLFLTTLSILKVCNSPCMQYYFKGFFCFAFLRSYIFISDKKVKAKSNRNSIFFSFPWKS